MLHDFAIGPHGGDGGVRNVATIRREKVSRGVIPRNLDIGKESQPQSLQDVGGKGGHDGCGVWSVEMSCD